MQPAASLLIVGVLIFLGQNLRVLAPRKPNATFQLFSTKSICRAESAFARVPVYLFHWH